MRYRETVPEIGVKTGAYGSVSAVVPLLDFLENAGCDVNAILDRSTIPRAAREDPRMRVPTRKFEALWQIAVEVTGDPAVALRVATTAKPNTFGVISLLALASESRRNAFELTRRLTPLLWEDFECDLQGDGEVAFIRCSTGGSRQASRLTTEYMVGLTVAMSRVFGTAHCDPLEARFCYPPPPHADEYERILRLPVRFDAGESGVLFPVAMMDCLNPSADAALRQLLERYAADQLAHIPTNAAIVQRVRACIRSVLPLGTVTADTVASRLHMSERTLRRRLQEEATSYQALVDDVRAELARHYLAHEKRGIDEVGFLLGFSDQSAFTKAFRRWTGRTPADFVRTSSS
ncbi:MAG: putative AraC family transcriptional regulator [Deltaproteobacteria bacterium]|nr:putative AraC family transcriptional regulator [Deltaproteobacteria bacterium]